MHSQLRTLQFETLDFARVRTFYRRNRSWIAGVGVNGGGRSPDSPRCCFPVDAGTPSIDRHSGRWHGRNIAKWPGKAAGGVRLGKCNALSAPGRRAGESPCPPSSHIGRHWTIGRRRGRMGAQNSTPVKMQTWGTTAQTSDVAVPYHLDTTLFFVSQRPYAGHGHS